MCVHHGVQWANHGPMWVPSWRIWSQVILNWPTRTTKLMIYNDCQFIRGKDYKPTEETIDNNKFWIRKHQGTLCGPGDTHGSILRRRLCLVIRADEGTRNFLLIEPIKVERWLSSVGLATRTVSRITTEWHNSLADVILRWHRSSSTAVAHFLCLCHVRIGRSLLSCGSDVFITKYRSKDHLPSFCNPPFILLRPCFMRDAGCHSCFEALSRYPTHPICHYVHISYAPNVDTKDQIRGDRWS